jgi:hypothetical protein
MHASMLTDPAVLIAEFSAAVEELGLDGWPCGLRGEALPAPHRQPALPPGSGAVYAFALSARATSAAGVGMVLKVGRVGPNSDARFRSQHYTTSGRSTLAKSLLAHPILWPWLGITQLDAATVKPWMLANLDRMHVYVPARSPLVLATLEMYVRARIGSVFEGSA